MKIVADLNKCQGHGLCVVTAPDVFDQGEDGLVQLKVATVADDLADDVEDAVIGCPEQALHTEG